MVLHEGPVSGPTELVPVTPKPIGPLHLHVLVGPAGLPPFGAGDPPEWDPVHSQAILALLAVELVDPRLSNIVFIIIYTS